MIINYENGDVFKIYNNIWLASVHSRGYLILVSLKDGVRYDEPIKEEDFTKYIRDADFKYVGRIKDFIKCEL